MVLLVHKRISRASERRLVNGQTVTVSAYALGVEISVVAPDLSYRGAPKVEAFIDTGNDMTLVASERHLGSLTVRDLPTQRSILVSYANGERLEQKLYGGDIWLYSTETGVDPTLISGNGFIIYLAGKERSGPKYPLLGNDALSVAGLKLEVDYGSREFKISTP